MKRPYIERIRQKKKGYYSPPIPAPVLAFPNAKGAGANITGGRGGQIVHVTNLNDSGVGSFRWAMQLEYPRIIVFDVSGRIDLQSILSMSKEMGNVTIAGQTAPEGGITISGNIIHLGWGDFCNNVIFRYIRFRNGSYTGVPDVYEHNGVVSTGVEGLIFDHCSFSFCDDQAISLNANYGNLRNITIQRCIFSENATQIIIGHDETMETGDSTIVDNLFVDISHRTPNLGGRGFKRSDIINNVIFNYGNRLTNLNHNPDARVNNIGNYYKRGNYSGTRHNVVQRYTGQMQTPLIYTARNYDSVLYPTPVNNDTQLWTDFTNYGQALDSAFFTNEMFELVGKKFPIKSALETYDEVLTDVGANKYLNGDGTFGEYSDSFDSLKISNTINNISSDPFNKTWIQPILPNNIRDSNFYNSNPHIPEEWFIANVPVGQDHNDIAPSGYTWIEEYLNQVDKSVDNKLPAFPTAYGAGAYTTGGRGGKVVHVTNLNDRGEGSLRWALTDPTNKGVSRTIVFDVSGVIHLSEWIYMSNEPGDEGGYADGITIAGQSAPEGGITITGSNIRMGEVNNIIVRYLKFRGDGSGNNSILSIMQADDVILDHISTSHTSTVAMTMSSTRAHNKDRKTIQNCLMGESRMGILAGNSNFSNGATELPYGGVSILRNAYYNVGWRAPAKFGGALEADVINNYVHNWSDRLIRLDPYDYSLNHIGNHYEYGANTYRALLHTTWTNDVMSPKIYSENNYISEEIKPSGYDTDESTAWTPFATSTEPVKSSWFSASKMPIQGREITILPDGELKSTVVMNSGAFRYLNENGSVGIYRDPWDTIFVNGIINNSNMGRNETGSIPEGMPSSSRPVEFYSSNPHIPEVWFSANVPSGQDHNDIAPSGYTWLEEYLNQVDK